MNFIDSLKLTSIISNLNSNLMSIDRNQIKSNFHSWVFKKYDEAIINISNFNMASLTAYLSTERRVFKDSSEDIELMC